MVRNGNGTKWLWYENDFHYGTKWLWYEMTIINHLYLIFFLAVIVLIAIKHIIISTLFV
jgi:hypothetical protein